MTNRYESRASNASSGFLEPRLLLKLQGAHRSREYKSVFGAPPMRDVQQQRVAAWTSADL
jgi:hypothetical protein